MKTKTLDWNSVLLNVFLGTIASLISTFIWAVGTSVSATANTAEWPGWINMVIEFWTKNVVALNLVSVGYAVIVFGTIAIVNRQRISRMIPFSIWTFAWLIQFVAITLERLGGNQFVYFLYFDAACSSLFLWGSLHLRQHHGSPLMFFLAVPFIAAPLSQVFQLWPSAFVDFFVFLYFGVSLLNCLREDNQSLAYVLFTTFSLYAAIQLLFPLMRYFCPDSFGVVRVMGYSIGAMAKFLGSSGIVVMHLVSNRGNAYY